MVFTQASGVRFSVGALSSRAQSHDLFRVHLAAKMTVSDTVHVGSSPAPGTSYSGIVQWLGQRLLMPPIGVRVPVPEPCTVTRRGSRLPCLGSEEGSSPLQCAKPGSNMETVSNFARERRFHARSLSLSSSWLGNRLLTSETGVRLPVRTPRRSMQAGSRL